MSSASTTSLIRIDTDTGDVTPFPLSDPAFPEISPKPYGLATGGDGAVWFTTPDVNSGGGASIDGCDRPSRSGRRARRSCSRCPTRPS